MQFSEELASFKSIGASVVGCSREPVKTHEKFISKYNLKIRLISDEDGKFCEACGVWVEKSMYGKKFMGIERATILIDKDRRIRKIWRKVSVTGHVEEVLEAAQKL